jgi:hypothetical protein
MKRCTACALAFAIWLAGPLAGFAAEKSVTPAHRHHHYHVHRHDGAARTPVAAGSPAQGAPTLANPVPPPAVQNDSDGLSRDGEDCNMGCLDNTE